MLNLEPEELFAYICDEVLSHWTSIIVDVTQSFIIHIDYELLSLQYRVILMAQIGDWPQEGYPFFLIYVPL